MMAPQRRWQLTLVACSFIAACSSGGRSSPDNPAPEQAPSAQASAASTQATACNAPVRGADVSSWQLVKLKSFTYCVPPDWRGGGGSWRKGPTSLNAGTGTAPRTRIGVQRVEAVRAGQRRTAPDQPPGADIRRFTETIGGKSANLYRNQFNGRYYVGATWDSPTVWITVETPDSDTADLALQIARTVRFLAR